MSFDKKKADLGCFTYTATQTAYVNDRHLTETGKWILFESGERPCLALTTDTFKNESLSPLIPVSVNTLQLKQAVCNLSSVTVAFYIQHNESGAKTSKAVVKSKYSLYIYMTGLRGRRWLWQRLQKLNLEKKYIKKLKKKKSRSHHPHPDFRTHRCFYNLLSKTLSAKSDHPHLDNSPENLLHVPADTLNITSKSQLLHA